jgi:hypothetical protein
MRRGEAGTGANSAQLWLVQFLLLRIRNMRPAHFILLTLGCSWADPSPPQFSLAHKADGPYTTRYTLKPEGFTILPEYVGNRQDRFYVFTGDHLTLDLDPGQPMVSTEGLSRWLNPNPTFDGATGASDIEDPKTATLTLSCANSSAPPRTWSGTPAIRADFVVPGDATAVVPTLTIVGVHGKKREVGPKGLGVFPVVGADPKLKHLLFDLDQYEAQPPGGRPMPPQLIDRKDFRAGAPVMLAYSERRGDQSVEHFSLEPGFHLEVKAHVSFHVGNVGNAGDAGPAREHKLTPSWDSPFGFTGVTAPEVRKLVFVTPPLETPPNAKQIRVVFTVNAVAGDGLTLLRTKQVPALGCPRDRTANSRQPALE